MTIPVRDKTILSIAGTSSAAIWLKTFPSAIPLVQNGLRSVEVLTSPFMTISA